jgi:hypothetical protein
MNLNFEVVKTMTGTNPDGSSITIREGDEVRIIYDNTVDASDDFKALHPGNTINARIYKISKTQVHCEDIDNPCRLLMLKVNQIVQMEHI